MEEVTDAWSEVMALKKKETRTRGVANTLTKGELETIIDTAIMAGANDDFSAQIYYDLGIARYRLFDWIAMLLDGRYKGYGCNENSKFATQIFSHYFLKAEGNVDQFIAYLAFKDYRRNDEYKRIIVK
jgi:hypothetical protein